MCIDQLIIKIFDFDNMWVVLCWVDGIEEECQYDLVIGWMICFCLGEVEGYIDYMEDGYFLGICIGENSSI